MSRKVERYEPFNPFIAEYLCQRLASLTPEEYKALSTSERHAIFKVGKIKKFIRQRSIFSILTTLTKIGINWGFYIIDKSFDLKRFIDIYEDESFVQRSSAIQRALMEQKSFITDSKQFSDLLTMMSNASHGKAAIWDRRFIEFSEKITTKVKDNFDNYDIMNEEVEYKKSSEGTLLLLRLFSNIPALTQTCLDHSLTVLEFSILCKLRLQSDNYFTSEMIIQEFGLKSMSLLKRLEDRCLISSYSKHYNINTAGILLTGKIFSVILDGVPLN